MGVHSLSVGAHNEYNFKLLPLLHSRYLCNTNNIMNRFSLINKPKIYFRYPCWKIFFVGITTQIIFKVHNEIPFKIHSNCNKIIGKSYLYVLYMGINIHRM